MKKRLLSFGLAMTMSLSLVPTSAIPVLAASVNARPGGAEYSGEIDGNVYHQLGLKLDAKESDATAPYSKDHTTSAFEAREIYLAANGAKQNVYTLRDGFNRLGSANMDQDDSNTADKLPGSPRNGAYEYYKQGSGCINPQIGADNGYKISSDLSSNNSEISLRTESQGFSGIYATSTAFNRGNGKDDCVAELRAWGSNKKISKKTGVNPWDRDLIGKVEVDVFHINDNGYRENISTLALPVTADMCIGTNSGKDFKYRYFDREFVQNLDGIFEIEAADVDGDGIDELFVYDGYTYESGDNRMARVHVYKANGKYSSYSKWKDIDVNAGPKSAYSTSGMHGIPNVTMASGDLDRDGRDEVAITASTGGGSSSFGGNVKIITGGSMSTLKEFSLRGSGSDYMAYPNVTFGTFNLPETSIMATVMIVAGYNGVLNGYTTRAAYRYFYLDPSSGTNEWRLSPYLSGIELGDTGQKIVRSYTDKEGDYGHGKTLNRAPFPLACANLDGVSNEPKKASDELFFGGDVYDFSIKQKVETNNETGATTVTLDNGLGQIIQSAALYINQKHDGQLNKDKGQVWISDVQSGIIDTTPDKHHYRESFIYTAGVHRKASEDTEDYYWMDIGVVGKGLVVTHENGTTSYDYAKPYSAEEGVICHSNVRNDKYGTYISLALPDIQDDSVLLRFKSAYTVYTNPEVYAVLQASPYFMDLNDTQAYIGNGGTSFGTSSAEGISSGGGFHQSVGVYHSAEVQAFAGGEYEVEFSTDFSYEYAMSHEVEHSVSYNAQGGGGDMVVVYAVPYVYYMYDMYNPKNNSWGTTIMPVPLNPTTSVISVDRYDEIAKNTAGLDPIRGEVLHSIPGAPETYQNQPSGSRIYTSKGDGKSSFISINSAGAGSDVTQEINVADGTEHNTSIEMDLNYKVGGGASFLGESVYVGVTGSTGAGFSHATSSTKGTSFSGTVDGLPEGADDYGFSWRLIVNQAQLNGAPVWVVGYEIVDVYQPPRMPRNVHVTKTTTDTMDIAWDPSGGAAYYDIYMETSTGEPNKIASVPYTVTNYQVTELYSNRAYAFCVQAVSDQGATSIISAPARGTTMSREAVFTITEDPKSVDPQTPVGVGKQHSFSARAEMTIADKPINLSYQWEYRNPGSEDWIKVRNGKNISGADSTTLTLSNVTENMNGRSYRCKVYHFEDTLYTKAAELYVGKEASTVTLSGVTDGQTVNASGSLPDVKEETQHDVPVNVFVTKDKVDYSLFSVLTKPAEGKNPAEYANYWKTADGKFYAAKGDIKRDASGFVTSNLTYANNVDTEINPVVTQQAVVFYKKNIEGKLQSINETVDLTAGTVPEAAPTVKESVIVEGNTPPSSEERTYTAKEVWTGTVDGAACTFYRMVWDNGKPDKEHKTETIYRYVKDSEPTTFLKYTPVTATTVDGKDPNSLIAAQKITNVNVKVPITTPVAGTALTLTAQPISNSKKLEGDVSFAIRDANGLTTIPAQKQSDGSYTAEWTPNTEGKMTIKAVFGGNSKYQASESASVTINAVMNGHSTLSLTAPAVMTYNTSASLAVTKLDGENAAGSTADPVTSPVYAVEKLVDEYDAKNKYVGSTYEEAVADADYVLSGNNFTPKLVTSFRITAKESGAADALSDTRIIKVNKATLTLQAKDKEVSLNNTNENRQPVLGSILIGGQPADSTVTLTQGTVAADKTVTNDYALESKGITTTATGEYPIYIRLNETSSKIIALRKNYDIQLETATYTVTKNQVTVTVAAGANGTASMTYAQDSSSNAKIPVQSGSLLPVGCQVTVNATPSTGYKVSKWTVNNEVQTTESGQLFTATLYTIKNLKEETNISVEFEAAKSVLNYGSSGSGAVYAHYMNGTVRGDTFTSGGNVNYNQTVRLTAEPKTGYVVDHWAVQKGTATKTIMAADGKSYFTGTEYDFGQFSEDMTVTVYFEQEQQYAITIAPTATDNSFLAGAKVTVGGNPLTNPEGGKYTYTGKTGENLTITVTPPDGILVDSWKVGEGQTTGSLSNGNRTMTIYNLKANVDFTVHCTALNNYAVTFVGKLDGGDFSNEVGTITGQKIGGSPFISGENLLQGSTVEVTAVPEDGYEITGWTSNGKAIQPTKTVAATGAQTIQVPSLYQTETIQATFKKQPVVTITAPANSNDITVTGTLRGKAKIINSGSTPLDLGSTVSITAAPDNDYVVDTITADQAYVVNSSKANGDKTQADIAVPDAGLTVSAAFLAKPTVTFTASAEKGTVTVAADKVNGSPETALTTGQYVDFGADLTVTLKPAKGFRVNTPTVNDENATGVTDVANSDNKQFTIANVQDIQTLAAGFEAIPQDQVTFSVVDKAPENDATGLDGTLNVSVARKNMDTYKVTDSTANQTVYSGSTVTFKATPNPGYRIGAWFVDGVEQSSAEAPVFTTDDSFTGKNVTVRFDPIGKKITYDFMTSEDAYTDKGTLSAAFLSNGTSQEDAFTSGSIPNDAGKLTVKVNNLADGYEVENWYVNGVPQDPANKGTSLTVSVTKDVGQHIEAKVIRSSYAVNFSAINGTVTAAKAGGTDIHSGDSILGDTVVTFTAQPQAPTGYTFDGWYVNGTKNDETGRTLTLTLDKALNVEARYTMDIVKYAVAYGVVDTNGPTEGGLNGKLNVSPSVAASPAQVAAGTKLTFTAVPAEGYLVNGWYSDQGTTLITGTAYEQLTYTIDSLTAPANVYVVFEKIPSYNITINSTGNGHLTATVNGFDTAITGNSISVKRHDNVVITAVPDENHRLTGWNVDSAVRDNSSMTVTLNDIVDTHSVSANFDAAQRVMLTTVGTVTSRAGFGDALEAIDASSGIQVDKGKNVEITADPASGYMVKEWKVNEVTVDRTNMAQFGMTHPLDTVLKINSISEETTVEVLYEAEMIHSLPADGTGYTVKINERKPTKPGTDEQIRDHGDAAFTVKPNSNHYLDTMKVTMGGTTVDCLDKSTPLPANFKVKDNRDGSYQITVLDITTNVTIAATSKQFKTEVQGLKLTGDLATKYPGDQKTALAAMENDLRLAVSVNAPTMEKTQFVDIELQVTTDGVTYTAVTNPADFPTGGITVYIPYSELTGLPAGEDYTKYQFAIIHMFSCTYGGNTVGDTEVIRIDKQNTSGITFKVMSLSPFAISWKAPAPPAPPAGGGGGGATAEYYQIKVNDAYNGTVTSELEKATAGKQIKLTVTPNEGKALRSILVTTRTGEELIPVEKDGKYEFKMPAEDVTVRAQFMCLGGEHCPTKHLTDNPLDAWYHDNVDFVVEMGIMKGVDKKLFGPELDTSRAMIVTMLYRMEGEPEVEEDMPFTDVPQDMWYYDAVRWAAANKVVNGYTPETFGPEDAVTREQMAAILYRYVTFKELETNLEAAKLEQFEDAGEISSWAMDAMKWANSEYLISGISETHIAPKGKTTRAQVAAMIMRFMTGTADQDPTASPVP